MNCDLTELGGEYFFLQPDNCDYCIGSPAEQAQWHVNHINKCLTDWDKIYSFQEQLISLIKQKGEEFKKKKEVVVQKIAQTVGLENWQINKGIVGERVNCWFDIILGNCSNSEQLAQKEQEWLIIAQEVKLKLETENKSEAEKEEEWKKWKTENDKFWTEYKERERKQKEEEEEHRAKLRENQGSNYEPPKHDSPKNNGDNTNREEEKKKCPKCGEILNSIDGECYGKCWKERGENWDINEKYNRKSFHESTQELFRLSNTDPSELDKSLWNNESSWEEYSVKLGNKKELMNFQEKIELAVKQLIIEKKSKLEQIKDCFKKWNIKQVIWENGKIIIFDNGRSREYSEQFDNSSFRNNIHTWKGELEGTGMLQIQALKKHLQDNNKNSLTWEEVVGTSYETNEPKEPQDTDSGWGWIIWIAIIVIFVLIIIGINKSIKKRVDKNFNKHLKKTKKGK